MGAAILVVLLVPVIVSGSMLPSMLPQCSVEACGSQVHLSSLFKEFCCIFNNLGKKHRVVRDDRVIFVVCPSTIPSACQPASCNDVLLAYPTAPSGNYDIVLSNGIAVTVYCDMEGANCDGEGGWMRIANTNLTQDGSTCPDGLVTLPYIVGSHRLDFCDSQRILGGFCDSATFSVYDVAYSSVCGRVRGYHYSSPGGIGGGNNSIDSHYVDGVSITHGHPRQHIWTFMAGMSDNDIGIDSCPCNDGSTQTLLPFMGDDYYCESGGESQFGTLHASDPLWDGQQCNHLEGPCCANPNLPYFVKTLNVFTADDVELRLCSSEGYPFEATPLDIIELYVK